MLSIIIGSFMTTLYRLEIKCKAGISEIEALVLAEEIKKNTGLLNLE